MECSANGTDSVRYIFNEAVRISTMDRMELSQLHPDFVRYGSTLLHQAVQFNHEASVESLSYVMDINVRDKAGRTPLDIALRESFVESARCLIRNGCEVNVESEDWKKRCEFWIDEDPKQHVIHRTIYPLAKQLMNWYASLQDPYRAHIILIGQNAVDLANFLNKSAPFIVMKTLAMVNTEGVCSFDFSHLNYSLQTVTITSCDMGGEVPSTLYNLITLESLSLVDNGITSISNDISKLKNLKRLRLSRNKLKALPDAIRSLINLRFLFCDDNILERLPDQIGCLRDLEVLDVSCNKLEKLSISLGLLTKLKCLKFAMNCLEFPPHQITKQGADEVLKYLNTFLDNPVQNTQVKVTLVGAEGVGKSTLVSALRYKKPVFPDDTDKTAGIDISEFELNQTVRMKVFDLCGDPSFLASHSLFVTENSLYLACFDMRQYTISKASSSINHLGRLQLWLEMIYSQAPSSHVIIVATNVGHSALTDELRNHIREDVEEMIALYQQEHKKQFEGEPVPQCTLCEGSHLCVPASLTKFYINQDKTESPSNASKPCIPHIVGYYEVSSKEQHPKSLLGSKNNSLQNFKCNLSTKLIVLLNSCVGYLIPQKCLYVRDRILEVLNSDIELQEMPIFTLERLREIALGCGMRDEFKIKMMLKYFHNQGEFLWFEDTPELCDTVIVKPQWLVDRLQALYSPTGLHYIDNGILQTCNVSRIWPDYRPSDQTTLLSLVRGLGLSFQYSSDEDMFPSLLPHGYPDKDSWPSLPSPSNHQVTVEFAFSFLPPSFFGDLMVAVTKRELVCSDLAEPSYYRYNIVFTTNLKACQGCLLHNSESTSNPLEDSMTSDQRHVIHIESLPHTRSIRATVRGPAPCCVLPEVRAAIKLVSDVRYPGIRFTERLACPVSALTPVRNANKLHFLEEIHDYNNVCPKGHPVGSMVDLTTGRILEDCELPNIRKLSVLSAARQNGQNILEDRFCPKLFVVLPIQFKPLPFKDCRVMDHVIDGYAVHFLCECPGYWHLVPFPGYRVRDLDEFFDTFGARVAKMMKLIFMLDDTTTFPSLKNLLLKIAIGRDHSQRDSVVDNVKALVDHYCKIYPSLMQECSSFLYEDVSYLVSGRGLSRSKLARILEVTPDGHHFGPLVCTYIERHGEKMWLCHKHSTHAVPVPISNEHTQDTSQ